ncbi:hypothetical protein ACHAWO_004033 [Cyclotella atomus]|uniref:Uncharacterized protein n=1 Tax=Cyclotella atomus TaxID=382360 RepID=A0ABD3N5H6_9STRA
MEFITFVLIPLWEIDPLQSQFSIEAFTVNLSLDFIQPKGNSGAIGSYTSMCVWHCTLIFSSHPYLTPSTEEVGLK